MAKFLQSIAAACTGLALAGCFSFEHADLALVGTGGSVQGGHGEKLREHVVVSNYGWYLFNAWPLVCGNAREDAAFPWAFFRDDVDENVLQNRLTRYAVARGSDASDLVMFNHEQILLDVYSIPVPIPYVCCFRERQLSCVLTPRAGTAEPSEKLRRDMDDLLKALPPERGMK